MQEIDHGCPKVKLEKQMITRERIIKRIAEGEPIEQTCPFEKGPLLDLISGKPDAKIDEFRKKLVEQLLNCNDVGLFMQMFKKKLVSLS